MVNLKRIKFSSNSQNKRSFDILYAGGLRKMKGGLTLIKAFNEIDNPNIMLHIFGDGEDELVFKELAKEEKRIIFHGKLKNIDLQKFYKKVDISIVPSECYENFPTVILESNMAGVPVIGSKIGGIPEMIKENYNGFIFEMGNKEELKQKIIYCIKNRSKLKKMKINCINITKNYNKDNILPKLERIYGGVRVI